MNILIVEDDPLMRELLLVIVSSMSNDVALYEAENADAAWSLWRDNGFDLVLCDWNLQGTDTGLDLARRIRLKNDRVPIVMVTGRGDRHSVIASHRAGLNGYIVKPFTSEDVVARLTPFFKQENAADSPGVSIKTITDRVVWLEDRSQKLDNLTLLPDAQKVMALQWQEEPPTAKALARLWQGDVIITTRLLSVANSSQMRRYGRSVLTLLEAITIMGVSMAIAQVSALLLNQTRQDRLPVIQQRMQRYAEESQHVAEEAAKIAASLKLDPVPYYTAGLLHRLGEFALLDVIEQCPVPDDTLDDAVLEGLLDQFSSRFGNAVKIHWHLPLVMREYIGASYQIPSDTVRQDLMLMNLAGQMAKVQPDPERVQRLKRILGLSPG